MAATADSASLDLLLAAALQVNGRASWGTIARALDIPERTATRRGQRLLDSGAVRVSTYLDTTIVGHARPLIVEVHTKAGKALDVARALARRDDASSVSVLEGSGEVVCMLLPRTPEDSLSLLMDELPAVRGLLSTNVSTVLRYFRSGYDWVASANLTSGVMEELRGDVRLATPAIPSVSGLALSPEDEALIRLLAADGRASVVALARELGWSSPTVRRRLDTLFGAGALHVRTEVSPSLHGLRVEALSWLQVAPERIESVGESLGQHPSVRFCVACTGRSQMMIDCLAPDEESLFTFLTSDVAALGVSAIARTGVVVAPVRRGPMVMANT